MPPSTELGNGDTSLAEKKSANNSQSGQPSLTCWLSSLYNSHLFFADQTHKIRQIVNLQRAVDCDGIPNKQVAVNDEIH